jgi:glutathione S-transferase
MAIKLYQFAISHYCEKARWALDHKGLSYEAISLLPGQHINTIRKMTGADSSVPVLDHDGHRVQGSKAIIDYLDDTFPENPLTPADAQAREAALSWEQRLDDEAGPSVRCYSYHHFLQRPKVVVPMLAADTPFYNRILLRLAFSRVDEVMRKWMKINEKTAAQSRQTMERYLTELADAYREKPYLVGDSFSRADLAAAALFAPMFQPGQYPVPWPKPAKIPKDIKAWLGQWQPQIHMLEKIYAANR